MAQGPVRLGAWEVVRPLGQGGMGSVFEVEHAETRARRALKLVRPAPGRDLSRARREVEALARVDGHPSVVRVHDCGEDRAQGALWIVMDLAEGGDLAARLTRGPLSIAEVVALGRALARGLAHVHARGVLHRDLKPANVLFDGRGAPKLVDFGVARVDDAARLTRSGDLVGTPQYLPPEAIDGAGRAVDARADVWGLGAVLYEALTGAPPVEAATLQEYVARVCAGRVTPPSRRRPEVPRGLEAVVLSALEPDRDRRCPSAEALARALDGLDGEGRAPGGGGRLVALVAALGLLGAAAAGVAALRGPSTPTSDPPAPVPSSSGPAGAADALSRLEPAAVAVALAREEPGPVLAALEARRAEVTGARSAPELRAALAGALLVAGDGAALEGWRAAAGPELRAVLDGVAGVLFGQGPPGEPARSVAPPAPFPGFEGLAHALRTARAAPLASAAGAAGPLVAGLERCVEGAEARPAAAPVDAALRVVVQRLVLARATSLAHAARRKGGDASAGRPGEDEGTSDRACAVAGRAAALSRAGPAHVALVVLRQWLLARRPGEGWRDPRLDPPPDGEAARLAGRYPAMRFVHLARRFAVFPDVDDEAAVLALLATWGETRGLAIALGLVTDDLRPTDSARLEDTPLVSLAVDSSGVWADLLGRQAWFGRETPDADRLAAEALAASEVAYRGNYDLGLFLAVRLHAMRGDLVSARATLGRVPVQRREDGLQVAFDGELALLEGELDRADACVAALLSGRDPFHGQARYWGLTLAAALEAARGRPEAAETRLRAADEWLAARDKPTTAFCPWRTVAETARQVAAARAGWRPWVAGRPWAR